MSTKLDPPRVLPLTPTQHARLRKNVMTRTRPAAARSWLVPLVAVGAVAAVVAGSITVLNRPAHDDGLPATETSPTPTARRTDPKSHKVPAPASEQTSSSVIILPFPTAVDLGPVSPEEAKRVATAKKCHVPGGGPGPLQVLWARRVKGVSPNSSVVTVIVKAAEQSTGPYSQEIAVCQSGIGTYMIQDKYWNRQPTPQHGISAVVGSSWSNEPTQMFFQHWTIYRARPGIARIESRYVWNGGAGKWIRGVVAGAFAYTDSRAIPEGSRAGLTEQFRAYDATGRPVPINPVN